MVASTVFFAVFTFGGTVPTKAEVCDTNFLSVTNPPKEYNQTGAAQQNFAATRNCLADLQTKLRHFERSSAYPWSTPGLEKGAVFTILDKSPSGRARDVRVCNYSSIPVRVQADIADRDQEMPLSGGPDGGCTVVTGGGKVQIRFGGKVGDAHGTFEEIYR